MPPIPPPAPILEPGFRLGLYELLCKIGQGGMATVWLARTTNSHGEERLVAVKTIIANLAGDDTARSMLLDEARIVQGINHPNVAATLEVGQVWDMPYLILEYVEGESVDTLCQTLEDASLSVPAAIVVRIIADAALGLHAAHELVGESGESLGIVHRDISPPNLLVDDQGSAHIIDFGVAKASERFTPQTASGVMKGRVPYMAPEHASGGSVDRRSDVWSLGAVAYYMLAGHYPFDGANDAARLIRILGTDGPDPLPDTVAPAVRDVIMRALSKDPDERQATTAELASALEASKLPATHVEVAQFFAETLAESIGRRHALVEHALAAADARARAREMLDGPMRGTTSYRPPAVAPLPPPTQAPAPALAHAHAPAPVSSGLGGGTLGSVTKSSRPSAKAWVPWVTASTFAVVAIVAFVLGTFNGRASNASSEPSGERSAAASAADSRAKADAEAKAKAAAAAADAEAMARGKAEHEAAALKAAAESKLAAETKAAETKPAPSAARTSKIIYTWPPPPPSAKPAPAVASASAPLAPLPAPPRDDPPAP